MEPTQPAPTPTQRVLQCLLEARSALMLLRSDIDNDVERRTLRDQLDAHCERIQQALKLLDPISTGQLQHSPPAAVDDNSCDMEWFTHTYDLLSYRVYQTGPVNEDDSDGLIDEACYDPDVVHPCGSTQ